MPKPRDDALDHVRTVVATSDHPEIIAYRLHLRVLENGRPDRLNQRQMNRLTPANIERAMRCYPALRSAYDAHRDDPCPSRLTALRMIWTMVRDP